MCSEAQMVHQFFKKWCRQIKKLPIHTGTCLFDRKLLRLGLVYSAAGVRGSFNIKTKWFFRLNPAVLQICHQSKTRTRTLWCRCGTDWGSVCQPHRINFRWVWFMTQGDHDHHSTLSTLAWFDQTVMGTIQSIRNNTGINFYCYY